MATQYTGGQVAGNALTAATMNSIGAEWNAYTPTLSAQSGTITSATVSARWGQVQKIVFVRFQISISNKGTGGGAMYITAPTTAQAGYGNGGGLSGAVGGFVEWTSVGFIGAVSFLNSTTLLGMLKYDWTTPIVNGTISGFAVYEAA